MGTCECECVSEPLADTLKDIEANALRDGEAEPLTEALVEAEADEDGVVVERADGNVALGDCEPLDDVLAEPDTLASADLLALPQRVALAEPDSLAEARTVSTEALGEGEAEPHAETLAEAETDADADNDALPALTKAMQRRRDRSIMRGEKRKTATTTPTRHKQMR